MMTWKEFKAAVEAKGVLDTDIVDYIGVDAPNRIRVARIEDQGNSNAPSFYITDASIYGEDV